MSVYDPLPQKQILSYQVRGPEIEALMKIFQQQTTIPLETLINKLVPPEGDSKQTVKTDLLREALNYLRAVEFIRQITDETQSPTFHLAKDVVTQEPFPLLLLRRLHSFDDERRAFRLITDLVVTENLLFARRKELVTMLESYAPGSYSWNEEKLRMYQQLADFLGLVRSIKPDQGDTMFSPKPGLLLELLRRYNQNGSKKKSVSVGDWLEFINDNYFSCFTKRQDLHIGLARALKSMQAMRQIDFKMHSDAPQSVLLEGQRVAYLEIIA